MRSFVLEVVDCDVEGLTCADSPRSQIYPVGKRALPARCGVSNLESRRRPPICRAAGRGAGSRMRAGSLLDVGAEVSLAAAGMNVPLWPFHRWGVERGRLGLAPGGAGVFFFGAAIRPSRIISFRASFRARRMASAFSRMVRSDGFS